MKISSSLILFICDLGKVGSFISFSFSGKGIHKSETNSNGGKGSQFFNSSASLWKAGSLLIKQPLFFFLFIIFSLLLSFLLLSSTIFWIDSSIISA